MHNVYVYFFTGIDLSTLLQKKDPFDEIIDIFVI